MTAVLAVLALATTVAAGTSLAGRVRHDPGRSMRQFARGTSALAAASGRARLHPVPGVGGLDGTCIEM